MCFVVSDSFETQKKKICTPLIKKYTSLACCIFSILTTIIVALTSTSTVSDTPVPPPLYKHGSIQKIQESIKLMRFQYNLYPPAPITDESRREFPQCMDNRVYDAINPMTFLPNQMYSLVQHDVQPLTMKEPYEWPRMIDNITVVPYDIAIENREHQNEGLYKTFSSTQCMSLQDWTMSAMTKYANTTSTQKDNMPQAWQDALNNDQWAMFQSDVHHFHSQKWGDASPRYLRAPARYLMSGIFEEIVYTQVFALTALYGTCVVLVNVPIENFGPGRTEVACVLDYRRFQIFDPDQLAHVQEGNLPKESFIGTNHDYQNKFEANDFTNPTMINKAVKSITTDSASTVCEAKFGAILSVRSALFVLALDSAETQLRITEQFMITTFSVSATDNGDGTQRQYYTVCNLVFGIDQINTGDSRTPRSDMHYSIQRRQCEIDSRTSYATHDIMSAYSWQIFPMSLYQPIIITHDNEPPTLTDFHY
jgi:hypothetical protein